MNKDTYGRRSFYRKVQGIYQDKGLRCTLSCKIMIGVDWAEAQLVTQNYLIRLVHKSP